MFVYSLLGLLAGIILAVTLLQRANPLSEDNASKRMFSFHLLALSGWAFSSFIFINLPGTMMATALVVQDVTRIFIAISALTSLAFALTFPLKKFRISPYILAIPTILVALAILYYDSVIIYNPNTGWHSQISGGGINVMMGSIYLMVYWVGAQAILTYVVICLKDKILRNKMALIYFGITLTGFISFISVLIQTSLDNPMDLGVFPLFFGSIVMYLGLKRTKNPV